MAQSTTIPDPSGRLHSADDLADTHGERFLSRASVTPFRVVTKQNHNPLKPLNSFRVGLLGYVLANNSKNAELTTALGVAINKLYVIQHRLVQNADYFREEIAGIKVAIDLLVKKIPS